MLDKILKWRKLGRSGVTKKSEHCLFEGLKGRLHGWKLQGFGEMCLLPSVEMIEDFENFAIEFAGTDAAAGINSQEMMDFHQELKAFREEAHYRTRKDRLFIRVDAFQTTMSPEDMHAMKSEIIASNKVQIHEETEKVLVVQVVTDFFNHARARICRDDEVWGACGYIEACKDLLKMLDIADSDLGDVDRRMSCVTCLEDILKWCDLYNLQKTVEDSQVMGFELCEKYESELVEIEHHLDELELKLDSGSVDANVDMATPFDCFWDVELVKATISKARNLVNQAEQADLHQHEDMFREGLEDLEDIAGGLAGQMTWYEGSTNSTITRLDVVTPHS